MRKLISEEFKNRFSAECRHMYCEDCEDVSCHHFCHKVVNRPVQQVPTNDQDTKEIFNNA